MKYLITGITGFAGPHLAKLLLKEGHYVYGLIRASNGRESDLLDVMTNHEIQNIEWLYGDLTNYECIDGIFEKKIFNGVFHLAAQSHPPTSFQEPVATMNNNVMGSANLIAAICKHQKDNCKLHFCSSAEVYGNQQDILWSEDAPLRPVNPYGVSKASTDIFMQERLRNKAIKGFITRAHSHTGPRRGYRFSISSDAYQLAKMQHNMQDRKLLVGNLNTSREVMDVRDCVRAYYLLMQKEELNYHIYNISSAKSYKMQFFTDTLIELSGLKDVSKVTYPPFYRNIDIKNQNSDTKRLHYEIDWWPEIPITQTLKDLLQYWYVKLVAK